MLRLCFSFNGMKVSTIVGGLGVVGPTRMDYTGTIASVRAVARYVGDLLAQN